MYKDKIDRLIHLLIEGESSIMSQKIPNPDTGRKIKVSSALSYPSNTAVHQKAKQLLTKGNTDKTEEKKPDEVQQIPDKSRKRVVAILDKLKEMTDEANAKGDKAPDYDLCKVSVPGTNLFCQVSLNIPREEMPQLKGTAIPGSEADKLPKDKKGEVDTEALFKEALKKSGAKMTAKKIDASTLKATQSQLVGSKVAGMTDALKKDPKHPGITAPIFVSKDGYILDGHHRWAAQVGLSLNEDKPVMMDVVEVDMDAKDLVKFTNEFCNKVGIKQKKGQVKESTQMGKITKIKLSEAIKLIEERTGKKVTLRKIDESSTADIAVPDTSFIPMKKNEKANTDSDYLTEDIPSTKVSTEKIKDGFQKLKSLASQIKIHLQETSVKTNSYGVLTSYAIIYPKKFILPYPFLYKLNNLGYELIIDTMGKYKVHIIQKQN